MSKLKAIVYKPDPEAVRVYDRLFMEYVLLHDYFGREQNNVMKRLKTIKKETSKTINLKMKVIDSINMLPFP